MRCVDCVESVVLLEVELNKDDIVRHRLVQEIVDSAYSDDDTQGHRGSGKEKKLKAEG